MEEHQTSVCHRKLNLAQGTYYVQTNPRATNIVLGEQNDSWQTSKKELHDKEAGNKEAETRRSVVRTSLKDRDRSLERKKTFLGHSMEFKSADQCKHQPYETDHKNYKQFQKEEVKNARYTGVYLPGAGDIRRMQSINAARVKKGLPPIKKMGM